jgi:hypothetical protein
MISHIVSGFTDKLKQGIRTTTTLHTFLETIKSLFMNKELIR